MQLTLEEMDMLATLLEEEQAEVRRLVPHADDPSDLEQELNTISQLQQKLRNRQASLTESEKKMLTQLLQTEQEHIHGHGTGIYESILNKVRQ